MGLDIYAGTMTRYYSGNWKTSVQQFAEINNIDYKVIKPNNSNEDKLSDDEIEIEIKNWQKDILSLLSTNDNKYIPWEENNNKPYWTDKPNWDCYGALLYICACKIYKEPALEFLADDFSWDTEPLIEKLMEDDDYISGILRVADCYIPLTESFIFTAHLPNGNNALIGTLGGLKQDLENINRLLFKADREEILSYSSLLIGNNILQVNENGEIEQLKPLKATTLDMAKYAFSHFYQAYEFAQKNQVVIMLDY